MAYISKEFLQDFWRENSQLSTLLGGPKQLLFIPSIHRQTRDIPLATIVERNVSNALVKKSFVSVSYQYTAGPIRQGPISINTADERGRGALLRAGLNVKRSRNASVDGASNISSSR